MDVPSLGWKELEEAGSGEPSARIRERVAEARTLAARRLRKELGLNGNGGPAPAGVAVHHPPRTNAEIPPRELSRLCALDAGAAAVMERAADGFGLTARGCHRVLRVARTVADLAGRSRIRARDVAEALRYRR